MNNEAIKKIANHYGFAEQSRQLMEEMAELTIALNKYHREQDYPSVECAVNLDEELADVTIMIEQIKYLLRITDSYFEGVVEKKLNRQLERIEKEWD